ncbi:MAG: phosphodiester glycosidase family protein [Firmicutes bacterium]|nr:phosphodiester glycosidase family protein [Bacillota bacterium]
MNKQNIRIVLSVFLLLVLVAFNSFALEILSEESKSEEIARGVILTEKRLETDSGWVNLFILEADLSVEGVKVDSVLSSNGLGRTQTMSQMANNAGAIAAVNADFFLIASTGAPLGAQMSDGRLIKSAHPGLSGWTHFAVDIDNIADFVTPVFLTNVTFADGTRRNVDGLNCEVDFTWARITVFDENFYKTTPGKDNIMTKNATDYTEVVVDGDNLVVDVRTNLPAVPIPAGGFVVCGSNQDAKYLRESAQVGDTVVFNAYADPSLDVLNTLVGGQPLLVERGQVAPIAPSDISGINPRTAVGISQDGKKVWLVVVDGRSSRSKGFTFKELAEYFKDEIGAYRAVNLDGGGSSAMVVKKPGTDVYTVVNKPSDGGERRVPNGLGVFIETEDSSAYNIVIQLESDGKFISFAEDTFNVPLMSTLQKINALVYAADGSLIDNAKVAWEVEPEIARVEYGYIKPMDSGVATVTAKVAGTDLVVSQKIRVLEDIETIEIEPSEISTSVGETISLKVKATDVNGFVAPIYPNDITWEVRGDVGEIKNGIFTATENTSGAIVAKFGGLSAGIPVVIGSNVVVLSDFENPSQWSFSTYPAEVTGWLEFTDEQVRSGDLAAKVTYDFSTTTRTRAAYLNYNKELPGKPLALGVWIYGDGNGHWFRAELKDATGMNKILDLVLNVDWIGWRYISTDIPQDMAFPVRLNRIYLVEAKPEIQDSGVIYVDDLEVVLPQEIPEGLLEGF